MLRRIVVVLVVVTAVGTCLYLVKHRSHGGGCDAPFAERIDPNSSQHVLPGATAKYLTNPPTSGAHQPGTYRTGVVTRPIPPPQQVALLEDGEVLLQYRGVSITALRDMQAFVRSAKRVTLAPNASLKPKIVATAWLWKMNCESFNPKDLREFVRAHQPAPAVN